MGTFEGRGDGLHHLSDDEGDIFDQDRRLIEAWHEILARFFFPKPANDDESKGSERAE